MASWWTKPVWWGSSPRTRSRALAVSVVGSAENKRLGAPSTPASWRGCVEKRGSSREGLTQAK